MNSLQVFQNTQFGQIRTLEESGKILFCGKDVADALGYVKARNAIKKHCLPEGALKRGVGVQTGVKVDGSPAMQVQQMTFIDEGNLYRLIIHSRLPSAQRFERWVFDEVLPTIRKTGSYSGEADQQAFNAKVMGLLTELTNIVMDLKNQSTVSQPRLLPQSYSMRDEVIRSTVTRTRYRTHLSKVDSLPEDIYCELVRMVINGVSYKGIAEWLDEVGFSIGKSSIGRFRDSISVINTDVDKTKILFKDGSIFTLWKDGQVDRIIV